MERPRRVPFEFEKNSRDQVKEKEKEDNIDLFGVNTDDFEEQPKEENPKSVEGTVSWIEYVDNLHLPSRIYNENKKKEESNKNINLHNSHKNQNFHDRNNNQNEKGIQEELEIEKIKIKRLEAEITNLKNIKETKNEKNILQFINIISYNSLGLGKK